jgi:hypothetical protein
MAEQQAHIDVDFDELDQYLSTPTVVNLSLKPVSWWSGQMQQSTFPNLGRMAIDIQYFPILSLYILLFFLHGAQASPTVAAYPIAQTLSARAILGLAPHPGECRNSTTSGLRQIAIQNMRDWNSQWVSEQTIWFCSPANNS